MRVEDIFISLNDLKLTFINNNKDDDNFYLYINKNYWDILLLYFRKKEQKKDQNIEQNIDRKTEDYLNPSLVIKCFLEYIFSLFSECNFILYTFIRSRYKKIKNNKNFNNFINNVTSCMSMKSLLALFNNNNNQKDYIVIKINSHVDYIKLLLDLFRECFYKNLYSYEIVFLAIQEHFINKEFVKKYLHKKTLFDLYIKANRKYNLFISKVSELEADIEKSKNQIINVNKEISHIGNIKKNEYKICLNVFNKVYIFNKKLEFFVSQEIKKKLKLLKLKILDEHKNNIKLLKRNKVWASSYKNEKDLLKNKSFMPVSIVSSSRMILNTNRVVALIVLISGLNKEEFKDIINSLEFKVLCSNLIVSVSNNDVIFLRCEVYSRSFIKLMHIAILKKYPDRVKIIKIFSINKDRFELLSGNEVDSIRAYTD